MASLTLKRTGRKMPIVGFGLWKVNKDSCADTVYKAIKAGYRLLDGACDYGNEKEAGEGVTRAIKDGLVKREDLFITSKLWNTFHAKEHVEKLTKYQLDLWGPEVGYFDLFLIHFPISLKYVDPSHRYPPEWWNDNKGVDIADVPMQETWVEMEKLVDKGLAKNIGLSNCQGSLILDVLRYARYQPQVLQIEHHPYLTQEPLIKLCKLLDIAVTGYSSFGPASFVELDADKGVKSLLDSDVVGKVAKGKGKTPAQILLRWATQRSIAVIPKTNHPQRLLENLNCCDFDLSEGEMKEISAMNRGIRFNDISDIDERMGIFA